MKYPVVEKVLADYEAEARKESKTSLKPPKKWWDAKVKEIEEGNPGYSAEKVDKTVGEIWFHNMTEAQRKAAREAEGKHYGPAK
jgi:hypothetical protein